MTLNQLNTEQLLQQQINELLMIEPLFKQVVTFVGLPALRLREQGFTQLYQAIVSQQLSTAAAESIWKKLTQANLVSEANVLAAADATFRQCGLSQQKIRYVRSLAAENIDYSALVTQSDSQVIETLTQVLGIGRWTAEIYLLFSLNRRDVFAANDLALQAATQNLFKLKERPKEREMRVLARQWSPCRSAAAYLLWAYYNQLKR